MFAYYWEVTVKVRKLLLKRVYRVNFLTLLLCACTLWGAQRRSVILSVVLTAVMVTLKAHLQNTASGSGFLPPPVCTWHCRIHR